MFTDEITAFCNYGNDVLTLFCKIDCELFSRRMEVLEYHQMTEVEQSTLPDSTSFETPRNQISSSTCVCVSVCLSAWGIVCQRTFFERVD